MGKLVAAFVLLAWLAGCAAPESPPGQGAAAATPLDLPTALALDGAFAFVHVGGPVTVGLESGSANVTLFGPDDHRLAAFNLTPASSQTVAVGRGELVLLVASHPAASGLWVRSGGDSVGRLAKLPLVSGFAVLDQAGALGSSVPVSPFGPTVRHLNVTLDSPPMAGVSVVAAGDYSNLAIELRGDGGPILSASDSGNPFPPAVVGLQGHRNWPIPATTHLQNVSGRNVTATLSYDSLQGAILITWTSYSRAGHDPRLRPESAAAETFTYGNGPIPDGPQRVKVNGLATRLVLRNQDSRAPAVVQIWDPQDFRLGPFLLPSGQSTAIPVSGGGEYVVRVLNGTASLGADRAPADYDFHSLSVVAVSYPVRRAGANGQFGEQVETIHQSGIPFAITESGLPPASGFALCDDQVELQLLQDNRTVGSNGPGGWWQAAVFMGDGPLVLHSTGFGQDGCNLPAVEVQSFVRQ